MDWYLYSSFLLKLSTQSAFYTEPSGQTWGLVSYSRIAQHADLEELICQFFDC